MLVSHSKRFIYTKTAKTASTSVESYFERYCLPAGSWEFGHGREMYEGPEGIVGYRGPSSEPKKWRDHMSAEDIRRGVGGQVWNSYFKFCVIRNPFERMVSAFHWLQWRLEKLPPPTLKQRLHQYLFGPRDVMRRVRGRNDIERFRDWLRLGGDLCDRDKYLIRGRICVDEFIRYEDLHADLQRVCQRLEIPFEPSRLPQLKQGLREGAPPLAEYYDQAAIQRVTERYRFELIRFGYHSPHE